MLISKLFFHFFKKLDLSSFLAWFTLRLVFMHTFFWTSNKVMNANLFKILFIISCTKNALCKFWFWYEDEGTFKKEKKLYIYC